MTTYLCMDCNEMFDEDDPHCPKCGSENIKSLHRDGNFICKDCDETFETDDPQCPNCGSGNVEPDE